LLLLLLLHHTDFKLNDFLSTHSIYFKTEVLQIDHIKINQTKVRFV